MLNLRNLASGKTDNIIIQLFRYTFVGGVAFIADYGVLILLTSLFGVHYLISAIISFIIGLIVNYAISVRWVFADSSIANKSMEFLAYSIIGCIGLVLNEFFIFIFTDIADIAYYISKPLTTVIVYFWNFFARRFLIFNGSKRIHSKES